MKTVIQVAMLLGLAGTALAQQTVPTDAIGSLRPEEPSACAGVYGDAHAICLNEQQKLQQQRKAQDAQVALQREEQENTRLRSEVLRHELAQQQAPAVPTSGSSSQLDFMSVPGFRSWQTDNAWFGSDRARTEFALLYEKQLRQERPDVTGRPLLDAVSARVREVFGHTLR